MRTITRENKKKLQCTAGMTGQSQNVVPYENLHLINVLPAQISSQKNTRALKMHLMQLGRYDHMIGEIQLVCQTALHTIVLCCEIGLKILFCQSICFCGGTRRGVPL